MKIVWLSVEGIKLYFLSRENKKFIYCFDMIQCV